MEVNVKFLIFKFGKLLLLKDADRGKWSLIEGYLHSKEDLYRAVYSEIINKSGWETDNIRVFQINVESGNFEIVFIVDAVKQTLQADKKITGLKWFPLKELPKADELISEDAEIIFAFADLIHPGKTLDLEHLPPVFKMNKRTENSPFDLPLLN